ncbi:MAG: HDOD domain-containing protein [Thermogutta sp.]|nr:HDOD domain-containing protein [Thermogutta sp.]
MSTLTENVNETLNRLAGMAGRLYSLPGVAMKVLDLADSPDADSATLKACIEKDPALTAKILRVVNSSLYSPSRPVGDLGQALALLGSKPLKLLVLGFSLPPDMFQGLEAKILAMYWRHTLTKAVAARELMENLFRRPGDEAFIAGLLQDLGMLVLIQTLGPPYQRLLEKIRECGEDVYYRERESLGFDHTALSAKLLLHWQMPDSLIEAVAIHSADGRAETRASALRRILSAAETLSCVLADDRPESWPRCAAELRALGGGAKQDPEALLREIQEKVRQLAEIFSVRLPPERSVDSLLAAAQAKMAETAEAMLREGGSAADQRPWSLPASELDDALRRCVQGVPIAPHVAESGGAEDFAAPPAESGPRAVPAAPSLPPPEPRAAAPQPAARSSTRSFPAWEEATLDPGLLGHLRAAVALCRRERLGLSLLLAEFVDGPSLVMTLGLERLAVLRRVLEAACRGWEHQGSACLPYHDFGCAWVLPDCERETAVGYGYQLMRIMSRLPAEDWPTAKALTLQIGVSYVAAPAPNFPPQDLYTAAGRCLAASAASGGGVVKSIEIY